MYKVILVDDEPWAIIDILHSITWEDFGFTVFGHYNKPVRAMEMVLTEKPDVVFTDIRMPVMDGFELIRQCRRQGCEAAFVLLSSYSDFEYAQEAIRMSVMDYCLKPVNPEALARQLQNLRERLDEQALSRKSRELLILPENDFQDEPHSFQQILAYIRENYQRKVTLAEISALFSFNRTYICSLFKRNSETTFSAYLNNVRIQAAKQLLESTLMPMGEIAEQTGFADDYYFNKVFKSICGVTPYQYRRQFLQKGIGVHGKN